MNKELEQFVFDFNNAWFNADLKKAESMLHENVVFVAPDLKTSINGKEACLQSLKDYITNSTTHHFEIENLKINTWVDTAVILLEYYVEYEFGNKNYQEIGTENWVLKREEKRYYLVWRAILNTKPKV